MSRQSKAAVLFSFLIALHVGAVCAFVLFFHWMWLLWTLLAWQLFAFIGLSVCLHRQVTHRAFRCTRTLELVHLTFACIAGQAGPITWASLHRAHHKHADTDSDIHSPNAGFWSAHAGWLLRTGERTRRDALKTPPADLCGNAVLVAFERAHFPAQILVFVLLYVAGGWAALCWLGCVRVVLTCGDIPR